ncbi:uncharacterized protein VICG_02113 [Vittaforma corneae ATCC 50505]|uniref:Uncharacterized protein n=1 Tax=Vittaforma corneae (strain ATCC 50505) TaxID=993615 RepID=L2GIY9_VITCO|nr:uncharacterized protein VICG_02113 [Vittaforma corneae ATCC 50505]ELA40853.1 hypothetical protein VICG_02113 [Vittaforma corneae ATCC 50505]
MRGNVGSAALFADLVCACRSSSKLDADFSSLVCHLENIISMCVCDGFCYELYCYIGLLTKFKRIKLADSDLRRCSRGSQHLHKSPMLDSRFNCPIVKDVRVPTFLFTRLSSKILMFLSEPKHDKSYTAKVHQAFKFYMSIGILPNKMFVHKLYTLHSGKDSLVDRILEMDLLEADRNAEDTLKRICVLFSRSLDESLRAKEDIGALYKLLFDNFRMLSRNIRMVASLFEEICKVHIRRIGKSKDVEELKALHMSMNICEKSLGKRSEKVEKLLRDRAAELLKK